MATISDLVYIDSTGYHFASYPEFLAWLTDSYKAIYGADVYLEPDSQDGQFLAILAQGFYDTASLGASVYNSFSPATAQGVGLSRNVKINGIERSSASYSTVTLTIVGTADTVITNGVAADTLEQNWLLPETVTIPGSGTIDVIAVAQNIGFVTAEANTITTIFTPTLGWQTVNNAAAATPGAAIETDAALRRRQALSTSIPAQTVFESALGRVGSVEGVTKVFGWENFTNTTDSIDMPPHSVNFTVVGGDSDAIANAIVSGKTPGTNPVGNTGPITVYDSQGMPLEIYYSEAVTATIEVVVTGTQGVGWSTDFEADIKQAVADYINALPIGSSIQPISLLIPASLIGTAAYGTFSVTDVQASISGDPPASTLIVLDQGMQGTGAQNPVCDPDTDVTVTIT